MGRLVYGGVPIVEIDDRPLAHLQTVIMAKLRRGEPMAFTWETSMRGMPGNSTVWLHPAIPVQFEYLGNRDAVLNRLWIDELIVLANSPAGLRITHEPTGR